MSEQEPMGEGRSEEIERINSAVLKIIELVSTEERYTGLLEYADLADLVGGLKELNVLDSHKIEESASKEYDIDPEDLIMEIYGLLDRYDLPADEILKNVGLFE